MSELNNIPAPQLSLNTPMDEPAAEETPVQSIQQQATPVTQQTTPPALDDSQLTDAERRAVDDFIAKVDITNPEHVLLFGADAQKRIADFSENALNTVKTQETGEVGNMLVNLVSELKGFEKVELAPGETKTVTITVEDEPIREYSDEYTVPAEPPKFPVTLESRFTDLRQTFMGRILYNAVLSVAEKQRKEAERMPDGPEKDNKRKAAQFLRRILESNSLRSMSMTAGSSMPYNFAQGFAELTNGHLIRGAGCFLKKIRVPKLPKEEQ